MSEVYVRFGEQLRKIRLERKLELADVAAELRMSEEHIAAIEAGDASRLPGPLFLQMFARSYSGFLGVDYSEAIDRIRDELGEPTPPSTTGVQRPEGAAPTALPPPTRAGGGARLIIGVIITIAVLGGLYLVAGKLLKQNASTTNKPRTGAQKKENDVVFEDETLVATKPYESAFLADSVDGLTFSLLARVPCSILLITDGDTAMNGEMKIDQDYQFVARQRAVISLGAPEAVDVRLNGQKALLTDARTKKVSNLEVTLGNYRWFLTPESPGSGDSSAQSAAKSGDSLHRRDTTTHVPTVAHKNGLASGGTH